MLKNIKFIVFAIALLSSFFAFAEKPTAVQIIPHYDMQVFDKEITNVYQELARSKKKHVNERNIASRIDIASKFFLGRLDVVPSIGDGPDAEFDKNPLYRTDSFDCFSYISTVIAIAESPDLQEFKKTLKKMNYRNGEVNFFTRYHFTNIEWNKVNTENNNFIQDITSTITDERQHAVAKISKTIIDRNSWYKNLNADDLKLFSPVSALETQLLLSKLHSYAAGIKPEESTISYIPLNVLFDENEQPNMFLFNQIPNASLIEIIRPNWDLESKIGTHIDVSHMGFAIRTKQGLMFREASESSLWGYGVRDVPLVGYLQSWLDSDTVKGINIHKII